MIIVSRNGNRVYDTIEGMLYDCEIEAYGEKTSSLLWVNRVVMERYDEASAAKKDLDKIVKAITYNNTTTIVLGQFEEEE